MNDNKNIIIAVCVCCLLMTMIIACSKGCGKKEEKKVVVVPQKKNNKIEEEKIIKESKSNYSYSSSRGVSSGKPPALLSDEDKAMLIKNYEEDSKKITELKKEWMKKKLEDPNISKVAYEQYKLRSNPSFLKGMVAIENKDYDTAILSFNEILKDKDSTAVSKYFACNNLMDIARDKHDFDLYFIAAKMRASLIEKEDLSIIGLKKDEEAIQWVINLENTLKAKNDPKYFDICVQTKLDENKREDDGLGEETSKEEIIQEVKDEIEYYSKIYKELIE